MSHIKVNLIKYSEDPLRNRVATFEWEYPRYVHSEVMTHRALSKNAASSRAIPAKKVRKQVWNNPVMPIEWSKNQSGMSADKQLSKTKAALAKFTWKAISKLACMAHYCLEKIGLHKQYVNRILEPWSLIKIVISGSEWNNFIWLRDHDDAQPDLQMLAKEVRHAFSVTDPEKLNFGDWHLPYVTNRDRNKYSIPQQLKLSTSGSAQISYRALNLSLNKANSIYSMLTSGSRVHASPFEHQFQAVDTRNLSTEDAGKIGFTHRDINGQLWSGNVKNWVQHRQLIPGHTAM